MLGGVLTTIDKSFSQISGRVIPFGTKANLDDLAAAPYAEMKKTLRQTRTELQSELGGQGLDLLGPDRWAKDVEQHVVLDPHNATYASALGQKPIRLSDGHHFEGVDIRA